MKFQVSRLFLRFGSVVYFWYFWLTPVLMFIPCIGLASNPKEM